MSTPDIIQIAQVVATLLVGGIGTWFLVKQNRILEKQNDLFERQNEIQHFLAERERSVSSEEDTRNTIRRIGLGVFKGTGQTDVEVLRLCKKGLSKQELRWFAYEVFKDFPQSAREGTAAILEGSYDRQAQLISTR